jgi:branched-chain amino acid transport system permease protein
LRGRIDLAEIGVAGVALSRYGLFVIIIGLALMIALHIVLKGTRIGMQIRASVDDTNTARAMGIRTSFLFTLTFALGSGLAGLGGALASGMIAMEPVFPLTSLVSFLMVVCVGGTAGIIGPFLAALLVGIVEVSSKYYIPSGGTLLLYGLMVLILLWRPHGLLDPVRMRQA